MQHNPSTRTRVEKQNEINCVNKLKGNKKKKDYTATVASTTVISSGLPPVAYILLRLALIANGDIKSLSNDNARAIAAREFAVICNLIGSVTPSTSCNISTSNVSGILSKTPSVATKMTSPARTGKLNMEVDQVISKVQKRNQSKIIEKERDSNWFDVTFKNSTKEKALIKGTQIGGLALPFMLSSLSIGPYNASRSGLHKSPEVRATCALELFNRIITTLQKRAFDDL
uniref:Uncharacterized protein n=1 Tax=Glossina austeni TaxID=7395 RepID=A0A1A9UWF6_GLOAU